MRILFCADIHIKLGQKNVPVSWAINRYNLFFKEIYRLQESVDVIILGGDIFDRIPTLPELELYFDFISGFTKPTLIYDGNHEATKKHTTFFSQLAPVSSKVNGLVSVVDHIYKGDMFNILPYCKLHRKESFNELNYNLPLFTHVRGEIPPHVHPEIDLDLFKSFPIVFAGDLHSHENCQRNIVYPGSPMTISFHRSKVKNGVILINDNWSWEWIELQLPQLIRKTVKTEKEMVPGKYDHIIYELEGNLTDLASVKSSDLLDKKVVKRSSDASLLLNPTMDIAEELSEYLNYILELDSDQITSILSTFNDYNKTIEMG